MEINQVKLIQYFHKGAFSNNKIGNIGLTFEKEINKESDNMFFPDFEGIKTKCTTRYSDYPIYLFSTALEGKTFSEIKRIIDKYGYYDKQFHNNKVLYEDINYLTLHFVNNK